MCRTSENYCSRINADSFFTVLPNKADSINPAQKLKKGLFAGLLKPKFCYILKSRGIKLRCYQPVVRNADVKVSVCQCFNRPKKEQGFAPLEKSVYIL